MKDFGVLKILDKFKFIFKKFGIDYDMMRKILKVKLTMDGRRVPSIMSNSRGNQNSSNVRTSLIIYAFLGLFASMFIWGSYPMFIKMNFILGIIIFMVLTTMISDYSTVLLDLNDKYILQVRPIDSKTLNAAKIIHIFIYLFSITIAISGASLIFGTIRYGVVFLLIFLLELLFITAFAILLTAIFYFVLTIFFDGEKLKDIINYFQIGLAIAMALIYQVMGRMFDIIGTNVEYSPKWWAYLVPSSWFAGPFSILIEHSYLNQFFIMTVLSIVIPIAAFILYFKLVVPYFERNLLKMSNSDKKAKGKSEKQMNNHIKAANIICRSKLESVFYRFTHSMISNERKFKLKVYPSLAFAAIFPFIMMFSQAGSNQSFAEMIKGLSNGRGYFAIYLCSFMLVSVVTFICYSDSYKAAWIYLTLPIENPGEVFKGTFKGVVTKLMLPIFVFESVVFILLCGIRIMPDVILMLINLILVSMITFVISDKELPFSKDFTNNSNNVGVVLLSMLICGITAAIHFGLSFIPFGVYINMAASAIVIFIIWKASFNFSWEQLYRKNRY